MLDTFVDNTGIPLRYHRDDSVVVFRYYQHILLDQAQIMLNMLRNSIRNSKISAHVIMEGKFDLNKTPLEPTGTKVTVHEKPNRRRTWSQRGVQVWYIRQVVDHYWCYKVYIPNAREERITDTVKLFPENITIQEISSADAAAHAATNLIRKLIFHYHTPYLHD